MHLFVHIDIQFNKIFSEIPQFLDNICNLKLLYLSYNNLDRVLYNLLNNLVSCTNQNQLVGFIFLVLEELIFNPNQLKVPLPCSLWQFWNLQILDLQHNLFTGSLPNLLSFSSLSEFDVSNNKLDRTIPENIVQPSNLSCFYVSSSAFIVVVTEVHLMNLFKLIVSDFSFNSLTLSVRFN